MSMKSVLGILVVAGAALTSATASSYAHGQGQYGQGPGPGMMGPMMGQGMGPGMMGPGMMGGCPWWQGQGMPGPGMMGQGMGPGSMTALPQDLSVENVRHMLEHQLTWQGNPNLKLGKVEEQDEDTIVAEIVTQDGSVCSASRSTGIQA